MEECNWLLILSTISLSPPAASLSFCNTSLFHFLLSFTKTIVFLDFNLDDPLGPNSLKNSEKQYSDQIYLIFGVKKEKPLLEPDSH